MEWRPPRPRGVAGTVADECLTGTTEGQDPSIVIRTLAVRRNIRLVLTGLIMTVRNQDERWRIGSVTTRRGADWRRGTCIHHAD